MMRSSSAREILAAVCACLIALDQVFVLAQQPTPAPTTSPETAQAKMLPPEQLDSLVAPIALYPDALLAQTLAASTYPLEVVQLQQWLAKNPNVKDKALVDAVAKQPWDPAVQSMAAFPDAVKRLADDIQWTLQLGNAVLAQESDVMAAVQRMRKGAVDKGALKSGEQQKVETKVIETKEVIVIEPTNPQVIYVPSYDPWAVWGHPYYPYPSIYYPYYYPGAAFVSFGVGFAMGAFWGGMWGNCGWGGGGSIDIDIDNNFNRGDGNRGNGNRGDGNRGGNRGDGNRGGGNRGGGGASWKHNPQHRGGTPYGDRATANKFGGSDRGGGLSSSNRMSSARQQLGSSGAGLADRGSGAGNRAGAGAGNRGSGSFNRSGSADRVGGRDLSRGSSGGYNGSRSRASSSRGSSSYGGMRGGGGGRGGGGRGGGGGGRR